MIQQRRCYIVVGLSRLSVRVVRRLAATNAEVLVIRTSTETPGLVRLLPEGVTILLAEPEQESELLVEANLIAADALLALSDDDLTNVRAAVAAHRLAPDIPVVLRSFDPALADQLEDGLNVRRAYSVSSLAAPAFIAAACGDAVLETLRLGSGEAPIAQITVRNRSPIIGKTIPEVKRVFGCAVIARSLSNEAWVPTVASGEPISEGEQLLVGGPLFPILRLICINASWLREDGRLPRRQRAAPQRRKRWQRRATHLPTVAAALIVVLAVAVVVFRKTLHLSLVDSIYFVVTTATTTGYGDISVLSCPPWVRLFDCAVMVAGGALIGVLFSYFASIATAERLGEWMGRKAERMSGHVVVAGLGNLGYRVVRLLVEQGLDVAVIELSPRDRFVEAIRQRTPVLTGDARLPENLDRASIRSAAAFISCTSDDLANVVASLEARRMNAGVTNVARIFDDALGESLGGAFAINHVLSASECAAGAFVGAAVDESAIRPISIGGLNLAACRYKPAGAVTSDDIDAMRALGVRVVAYSFDGVALSPASAMPQASPAGAHFILCGPMDAVKEVIGWDA
jgi:Trk K+ transport system NAD-binding subunit